MAWAGPANRYAARGQRIDPRGHRRARVVIDVIRLIPAGDEERLGFENRVFDKGLPGASPAVHDESRNRVEGGTESTDVPVVDGGAAGTDHQEVPAIRLSAHPLIGGVHIRAAAFE